MSAASGGEMRRLSDLMTMGALARKVKMNRERLRKFCIEAGIAVEMPGTKRLTLRARLRDVEKAIMARRYVPPSVRRQPPPRRPSNLHPLVTC